MNIEKKPIKFEDERGIVRDIIAGKEIDACSALTCKAGSVRGNHYHKQTLMYIYILSGRLVYALEKGDGSIETQEVKEGDLITVLPGDKHALKAIEDSVILNLTKGPRQGDGFAKDTFRLEKNILE